VVTAGPLADGSAEADGLLARALATKVRAAAAEQGWSEPAVALVDHGSPQPAVTAVRDRLAAALAAALGRAPGEVRACSMERREGPAYAFNEPLLERVLGETVFAPQGRVVIALQFLGPGRHAGPGGDIAGICERARAGRPGLETVMTATLGESPEVLDLLVARYSQALAARGDQSS
jgi:sirohydrochlorin ferrochelatase